MASVTQTIPQFSLGMSEQPDNLKFPGQVTDIVNAIPDVTNGLFKRPGAKRIGTDALTNVQSGLGFITFVMRQRDLIQDKQLLMVRCVYGVAVMGNR